MKILTVPASSLLGGSGMVAAYFRVAAVMLPAAS